MEANIEFLEIYTEICLGTVAFMAIVATLRQTLGESLTAYQYLITRFFIDVGLIHVITSLSGLVTFSISGNMDFVWQVMAIMLILTFVLYVPYYLAKRSKVSAPKSGTAIAVILSVGSSITNLILAFLGLSEVSLSSAAMIHLVVVLAAMVGTFLIFLGTFMNVRNADSE